MIIKALSEATFKDDQVTIGTDIDEADYVPHFQRVYISGDDTSGVS